MRPHPILLTPFLLLALQSVAHASSATVPDDFPTVQLAIDSGTDSVLIRDGSYPERIRVGRTRLIMGLFEARPRMQGMTIRPTDGFAGLQVKSCAFDGAVELQTGQEFARVTFDACTLDSGIVQRGFGEVFDYELLSVYRSKIRGNILMAGSVHCEADTFVTGGVILDGDTGHTIVGCRFEGSTFAAIAFGSYGENQVHIEDNEIVGSYALGVRLGSSIGYGDVTRNRISGCTRAGIDGEGDSYTIVDNVITNCATGIVFSSWDLEVRGNVIRDCATGMSGNFESGNMIGNVVVGSTGHGIDLGISYYAHIEGNVVGRSGGDGLRIGWSSSNEAIRGNTSYRNGGAGFRFIAPTLSYGRFALNNIAFENVGYGIDADTGSVSMGCNDLYGNQAGPSRGVAPSATNLAVDPLFCDVDQDSVGLRSTSPLLNAPGCGLIGARGESCTPTPTLVTIFTAERRGPAVLLRWRLTDAARLTDVGIERASTRSGPWSMIPVERSTEGEASIGIDRSVSPESEYWYRLVAHDGLERVIIGEAISVSGDEVARFALGRVSPNPGPGPVRFEFTLSREARVEIDVFDVLGRHVASALRGTLPAGSHSVQWSGTTGRSRIASGQFWVRYRYPGGQQAKGFVVSK